MQLGVFAEPILTGDQDSTPPKWFTIITPKIWFEIFVIQTWLVKYGPVVFDTVSLAIYSLQGAGGTGHRELIAKSSTVWQPSELSSDFAGIKQVYFKFDNPPLLKKGTAYAISLVFENYTGTPDAHVAWVREYNDPIVPFAGQNDFTRLHKFPFRCGLIGREVRP